MMDERRFLIHHSSFIISPYRRQEAAAAVRAERDAGLPQPLTIPELTRDLLVRLVERFAVVGVGAAAHLRAAPRERLQKPVGVGERLAGGADDVRVAAPQNLLGQLERADAARGHDGCPEARAVHRALDLP